jgi:L-2,4-diaminobutyrate decarboxylase
VVFGGAGANFSCLLAAREHLKRRLHSSGRIFDPRRTRVLANRPFTHFSLRRGLHMLGLGNRDLADAERQEAGLEAECLREVATSHFRTDVEDLERQIEATLARGEEIMCVFIVAGDSRFMAFDDIDRVADIAGRYGLWVHVDACEGGQVLFSPRLRPLMRGVERAASISMDPHKVLMVPYNMSLFFLRDPDWLRYFSADPVTVINQDDTSLGGYTPGVNSKSFLSLKLLFMLQHWGWDRLAAEMDRRHELAVLAADWIAGHPRLRLVNPDVTHNAVAFMYIPEGGPRDAAALNALNKALHQRLNMRTRYFVHGFPARDDEARIRSDKGTVYALRMMFGNPMSQSPEVVGCLEEIVKIGFELAGGSV